VYFITFYQERRNAVKFRLLVTLTVLVFVSCLLSGVVDSCFAQCLGDSRIQIQSGFFSTGYYCGSHKLTGPELEQLLSKVPGALEEYNSGKSMHVGASILQSIGGFLIGWPLGEAAAGAESPNWTMAAVGGGIAIPGIILEVLSNKHIRNAIDTYNSAIDKKTSMLKRSFRIGLSSRGLFVAYSF